MEREIRSWSECERALCEAYLLTRVYSVSYVRVVSVRPGYALIRFGSVFRDVGLRAWTSSWTSRLACAGLARLSMPR